MRRRLLAWLSCLWLTGSAAAAGWLLPGVDDVAEPRPELVAALHAAADAARAAAGLAPTAWDDGLARAARQHAAELAGRGLLDHASPTPGRATVADRMARSGSPYTTHGENLAFVPAAFDAVRSSVEGWLASPPHRANLLEPGFDRVGFGTAVDDRGGVYVVQVLAAAPWAPTAWSAAATEARRVRLAFGLRVERPTSVLVEVDGTARRFELAAGAQRLEVEVATDGPWPVRIGVASAAPGRFTLDEAGTVAVAGSWRPEPGAPRRHLRVAGTEAARARLERVEVRLELPSAPRGVALLVDGVHRPDARSEDGRIAVLLDLADGGSAWLTLAEPDGAGRLRLRHGVALARVGDAFLWTARP
jgi:hypothetical protein